MNFDSAGVEHSIAGLFSWVRKCVDDHTTSWIHGQSSNKYGDAVGSDDLPTTPMTSPALDGLPVTGAGVPCHPSPLCSMLL